jgi:hypothetical protein
MPDAVADLVQMLVFILGQNWTSSGMSSPYRE